MIAANRATSCAAAVTILVACQGEEKRPTFSRDIAPIISAHCADCHRPGGLAPFVLQTYEDARHRGQLIADVTRRRIMPPWLPDQDCREFRGARGLTDEQIEAIEDWVDSGMPPGDLPVSTLGGPAPGGWQLGPPGLEVSMSEPYTLAAEGSDLFRNFVLIPDLKEPVWVRAIELRVANRQVIHHAQLTVDRTGSSRRLDEEDPEPGFAGMLAEDAHTPEGFFVGWAPGKSVFETGEGMAWRLEPGTDLVLNLHLRPSGEPETIQVELGFHFADGPPRLSPALLRLGAETMDIPAGATNYTVADSFVLPAAVDLLSLFPHAHFLAREMHVYAKLPNGGERCLLEIDEWDFNWQDEFRFVESVTLPARTMLVMEYVYDNSASNPANPHQPPTRVNFGPNAADEMGDLWVQAIPREHGDLALLRERSVQHFWKIRIAGWEKMLEKEPERGGVHFALATALQTIGRLQEAAEHYREALRLRGDFSGAHNNLANTLRSLGRVEEAMRHYLKAIEVEPGNPRPYLNLAETLHAAGKLDEAILYYRGALQAQPDYARAHHGLATALTAKGEKSEALKHLREAARLEPDWPAPLTAQAWILATEPGFRDPSRAIALAEHASALAEPQQAVILHTLAAAYASGGQFDSAITTAQRAVNLAMAQGDEELAANIRQYLDLYRRIAGQN